MRLFLIDSYQNLSPDLSLDGLPNLHDSLVCADETYFTRHEWFYHLPAPFTIDHLFEFLDRHPDLSRWFRDDVHVAEDGSSVTILQTEPYPPRTDIAWRRGRVDLVRPINTAALDIAEKSLAIETERYR